MITKQSKTVHFFSKELQIRLISNDHVTEFPILQYKTQTVKNRGLHGSALLKNFK